MHAACALDSARPAAGARLRLLPLVGAHLAEVRNTAPSLLFSHRGEAEPPLPFSHRSQAQPAPHPIPQGGIAAFLLRCGMLGATRRMLASSSDPSSSRAPELATRLRLSCYAQGNTQCTDLCHTVHHLHSVYC